MGTHTPSKTIETPDSYGTAFTLKGTHNDAGCIFRREWAPTAAPSDFDDIILEQYYAKNDALEVTSVGDCYMQWVDVSDTTEDVRFGWQTMVDGTKSTRFFMGHGFYANGVTGGDKGDGTINAKAIYDDNALLSCYVFDAVLDGEINIQKWDDTIGNGIFIERIESDGKIEHKTVEVTREHESVRKFNERIGSEFDPLDIDKYADHWKEKRHLTAMPNEENFVPHSTGEWIQRLVETVEIQAVHIDQLNQRLKALEAQLK